jgi:type I restriction enzyme R subunit
MSEIGDTERLTQDRIIRLFREPLSYAYMGNWECRSDNSNIEEELLRKYFARKRKYSQTLIDKAIFKLKAAAADLSDGLYAANKKVYGLLRYGVEVKAEAGQNFETVELLNGPPL